MWKKRMATTDEIDEAILTFLKSVEPRWRKVAMTVVKAAESLAAELPEGDDGYHLVHGRILALFEAGTIEAQGDLNQWRFSEIRAICCGQ
jgi:hypothetical protein